MKKITAVICVVFVILMIFALPASAAAPYQTYTYSINGTALYSPDAYVPDFSVDSAYMGLLNKETMKEQYPGLSDKALEEKMVAISSPGDLETDEDGNVYIADTDNNRIVVLDRYYKLKFIIESFINEQGVKDGFANPKGVFITDDKTIGGELIEGIIYVCDTNHNRIVTFDKTGNFISIIKEPESEMFETGSIYKPVAIAVDKYDRLYVVSSTTYQGIIVMTNTGEFTQFVGAQKVDVSAWEILWRRFQTEEQRARSTTNVSTEFNNISINENGHIYVTTSTIAEDKVLSSIKSKSKSGDFAPVKLLNAAGDEIMKRNGFYPPSGEVDVAKLAKSDTISGVSTVVDVAVGPEGTWSIIDQKRSKVFTYDKEGNLLFAFGDTGRQLGNISSKGLSAVTYQGDKMLLLDMTAKSFTVYKLTEYGEIIQNALANTNNRQFDKAVEDWTEILKRNSNFDTAYIGIGNALYRSGEYEEAIEYYKAAYDTTNYSDAYKEVRKEWISKYIFLIPIIIFAICLGWTKFMKFAKKVNKKVATSGKRGNYGHELLFAFHLIFHPFDGFWDLKHEKRGSVRAGATILAVTILAFYYRAIGQGYILNPKGEYSTVFSVILSVLVPLFLWIVANWCLTTLFNGEGSFKDIFIASTYSLTPCILIMIPVTIASNFVISTETDILNLLVTFAFIWLGLLLFFGMMVTHDYSLLKNIGTVVGTIIGMVCIMFIAILFSTLLGKLVSFVTNIITEIQYRV